MTDDAPQGDPPAFRSNDGLGPLPEPPTFYRYQFQAHYGPVWRSSAETWNGCPPLASEGLYSAEQMRAYAAQGAAVERERIFGHIRGAMGHAEAGYDDVAWRLLATLVGPGAELDQALDDAMAEDAPSGAARSDDDQDRCRRKSG